MTSTANDGAWSVAPLVAPTPLAGANGMRFGADGALYVAQASGCRIGRIAPIGDAIETVAMHGGEIVGPDDIAFDSHGNMFITEVMNDRVSVRRPNGRLAVIAGDTPAANGITVHDDRIFMSEFNPAGRILELDPAGGVARTIATDLVMPNALQRGPDGMLYFPQVALGEIWRVAIESGVPERVFGGLAMPTAVKFDATGRLWACDAATGAIVCIDPVTGLRLATHHLAAGLDNLVFAPDGRMLVSYFTDGAILALLPDGSTRTVVAAGLVGPYGLAVDGAGRLIVADGASIAAVERDGTLSHVSNMVQPGSPGHVRGMAVEASGALLTTNTAGDVVRVGGEATRVLAGGFDQLMGVVSDGAGSAIACEAGTGRVVAIDAGGLVRVLATGLDRPSGIHRAADGVLVAESGAGRVLHIGGDRHRSVVMDGLVEPHGITTTGDGIFVLDAGTGTLHLLPVNGQPSAVIAADLPVAPPGARRSLPGIGAILPGPILRFADLAAFADGSVAVGADGVGAILRVRRRA